MLLLLSEINNINMKYFDFRFDRARSKLCTKPGALSGNYELRVSNYELLSYIYNIYLGVWVYVIYI